MRTLVSCLVFLSLLLTSCGEETTALPVDPAADRTFFPLELNRASYYAVDSITLYNEVAGIRYDTVRLEARETLRDTFTGADGLTWYRGEREERRLPVGSWQSRQTFAVAIDENSALRREDNLTFTKLVFPIRQGRSWPGNSDFDERVEVVVGGEFLDVYRGWEYRYAETEAAVTLETGFTAENTTLVVQASDTTGLIDRRVAFERYAPGIGLVERFIDARHTQCQRCCGGNTEECIDLPWDEKSEKGFLLHQRLLRRE